MIVKKLHNWDVSYKEAAELQRRMAGRVRFTPVRGEVRLAAGLDCTFSKNGKKIIAVGVVLSLPDFEIVETAMAWDQVSFPYIPGLLSFREAPICLKVLEMLKSRPDVVIVDGQGVSHPRRLGIAAHIGLHLNKPTIGCAKSRLIGTFEEPQKVKGSYSPLMAKRINAEEESLEIIGTVLRTRTNIKPVFVSVGNRCTLEDAISITLLCCTAFRLPEPSRIAHQMVTEMKRNF